MDKDNPDQENIVKWILINSVENAEEVTETYDTENLMKNTLVESDLESDGISIISHNESSAGEEYILISGAVNKIDNVTPVSNEDTTKWTLSDSEVISLGLPSKTFFLDCLQEPIEELSDQELGTNQSDPKSDDVAIVSKLESDFKNDNESSLPEPKKGNIDIQHLDLLVKFHAYIHKYFNGLIVGTIFLATISIFLGSYLDYTNKAEDELQHHRKNFDNILKESSDKIDKISKKYDIITTLYLCEQKFKSDNSSRQRNVHDCLVQIEGKIKEKLDNMRNKQFEKMQKNLKIKEHYLNEKEKFLIKKEYELLKAEMKYQSVKKQHNFRKKHVNHFKFDTDQRSFKSGHDFQYEINHIHKDLLNGNIKPNNKIKDKRNYKVRWKGKKDKINESKVVLRAVQEHFYEEKDKYFKIHRNKLTKDKEHKRKYDNTHKAKKTKGSNDDEASANNERKHNYNKHDKA